MKGGGEKHWLPRFEIVLSLIAIGLATFSIFLNVRQQRREQAPNIQLESFSGKIEVHRTDSTGIREFRLNAKVVLNNLGASTASLINISWDPIDSVGLLPKRTAWLAASEYEFDSQDIVNLRRDFQKNPLLGLQDTEFPPGKPRTLWFVVQAESPGSEIVEKAYVRIRLAFSNGQEIVLVPKINQFEYSETTR